MKTSVLHQPLFRLLAPVFFGLLVYLMLLLLSNQAAQLNQLFRSQEMYVCMVLAAVQSELLRIFLLQSEKRIPGERRRWWLLVTAGNGITVILLLAALRTYYVYQIGFTPGPGELGRFAALYLPGGWFLLALYASQFYLNRRNTAAISRELERRSVLEQEFSDFSHELAPGLLYRSLEQVLVLMDDRPEAAEAYLELLARHYRYRLLNRREEVVSLAAELEAAQDYLRLQEGIRQQELALETAGELPTELRLPPGSVIVALYWLLANSLAGPGPLSLRIRGEAAALLLSCPSREKLERDPDSTYAFDRLCRSYRILSDHRPQLSSGPEGLSIRLPLLSTQTPEHP